MDHRQQTQFIGYAIGGGVLLLVLAFRMRRMMQSRPYNIQNIWILPAILTVLTVMTLAPKPLSGLDWLWVAGSLAVGGGLGWLRAKTIRLTIDPETRQIMAQGSPLAMIFLLALFVSRFALRSILMAQSSNLGVSMTVVDGAFLSMACGLFVARAIEMGIRAKRLLGRGPASIAI